ncbi:MAG: hypothetical protein NXI30_21850 [bacterium]|nr:hypothetical protein [bacterium]
MELEVSAWTRRDRLERIAAAERDRRAGRTDLALAALGEGTEWPARLVLALARLPEEEGADAREILQATLDDWAAETGLASLDPAAEPVEAESASDVVEVESTEEAPDVIEVESNEEASDVIEADPAEPVAEESDLVVEAVAEESDLVVDAVEALDEDLLAPIEHDELERAFAEAEAQTDEMHDVNDVAERVLLDEPVGLSELDGDVYGVADEGARADEDTTGSGIRTDAAWAEAPIWPEPIAPDAPLDRAAVAPREAEPEAADAQGEGPSRAQVITTLEQWLENLLAGRAQ